MSKYGNYLLLLRNMKKSAIYYVVLLLVLPLLFSCSVRTFHINSDPGNAKVYYQTRRDKVFKGYTPISFDDKTNDISPASKVILEKDGYTSKEVNIGGFTGTDVSLQVKLDQSEDMITSKKEPTETQIVKPQEPQEKAIQTLDQKIDSDSNKNVKSPETQLIAEEFEALRRRLEETETELRALKEQQTPKSMPMESSNENTSAGQDQALVPMPDDGTSNPAFDKDQLNMNRALQHIFKAQQLLGSGDKFLDEALVETFKAISINNKFAFAYAVQGTIYYKKNDYVSALDSWKKSIQEDPTNLDVVRAYNKLRATLGTNIGKKATSN